MGSKWVYLVRDTCIPNITNHQLLARY